MQECLYHAKATPPTYPHRAQTDTLRGTTITLLPHHLIHGQLAECMGYFLPSEQYHTELEFISCPEVEKHSSHYRAKRLKNNLLQLLKRETTIITTYNILGLKNIGSISGKWPKNVGYKF